MKVLTDAPVHFGLIQPEHWYQPEWIDEDLARRGRLRMMEQGIIYGGTLSNAFLCISFNVSFLLQAVSRALPYLCRSFQTLTRRL